jgi:hypothetical protein
VATVATKLMTIFRKRGLLLLAISAISALLAAKTGGNTSGPTQLGFWDGPS